MIAMLLAGGQGSRLGVLTSDVAKPAVAFGGKYRIIDFPLSNCINSGIDTIAEWKIDNSVLAAKCYRRLGDVRCQNSKSAALTAS